MPVQPPRHRGIYLLPNLFTTAAMFAGFYAIISGIGGHYTEAAIAVFLAAVLDGMDGRVARMTGTQTEFGVQYDSLSDLVSFGLAPALVMYTWSLSALRDAGPLWGKLGWACAFIYAACAALRLARFNTQAGVADKRYFQGLASPAAAAVNMSFVWTMEKAGWSGAELAFASAAIVVVTGLLWTLPRPSLTVRREITPLKVARGEVANGVLEVTNTGRFRRAGMRAQDLCGTGAIDVDLPRLGPGRGETVTYALPTDRRGEIPVGPLRLVRADPFGLARRCGSTGSGRPFSYGHGPCRSRSCPPAATTTWRARPRTPRPPGRSRSTRCASTSSATTCGTSTGAPAPGPAR